MRIACMNSAGEAASSTYPFAPAASRFQDGFIISAASSEQ